MNPEIEQKVADLERVVNDVLRSDLAKLSEAINKKNEDIAEFLQLKGLITTLKNNHFDKDGFKTKVDIGNNFFVQAHVEDASMIYLDVGLGYFVEFTLDEALVIINIRVKLLQQQIAHFRREVARTNAHIKVMLLAIGEIRGYNKQPEKNEV